MNQLKTIFLLGILSVLLVWFGNLLSPGSTYLFLGLAVLMNFGAYFFSDKMVLAMHRAKEIGPGEAPGLHAMVAELARAAEIPTPRLYLIPANYANAFATGRNPKHGVVAVTEGILRTLSERELRGVIAHEIAHIKNRDILVATVAATIAAAISSLANMAQFAAMFGGGHRSDEEGGHGAGYAIIMAIIAPIAALIIQMAISRSREYLADETGAKLARDPEALASALARLHNSAEAHPAAHLSPASASLFIVNPFGSLGGFVHLFSTHPPMEERIKRLHEMARNPSLLRAA